MLLRDFALLLFSVLANVGGQIYLKSGALKLADLSSNKVLGFVVSVFTTPELLVGLSFYAFGALAYIALLSKVDLSIVGPSTSLVYVCSVLIGYFIFDETISLNRLVGLGFIMCGVILVIWQR